MRIPELCGMIGQSKDLAELLHRHAPLGRVDRNAGVDMSSRFHPQVWLQHSSDKLRNQKWNSLCYFVQGSAQDNFSE